MLRGGNGQDRAEFGGILLSEASFTLNHDGSLRIVLPDGTDTLHADVEYLAFGDGIISYAQAVARVPGVTVITGSPNPDNMAAIPGAAVYLGQDGGDWITPGDGPDTVDGGSGTDMASFVDASARAVIDLDAGTAVIGADTDRLISIENVTGTIFADLITGDAASNRLRGLGDYDWLVGSGGNDTFEGGTGRDTVAYSSAPGGVTASLMTDTGTGGQAAGDIYIDIENLTGSSFVDRLTGDNDRNILRGLAGDDFLFGLGGNDRITGGRGNDTIFGGTGWDTALYSGNRSDYTVTTRADGTTTVLHNGGGIDGLDIVQCVEVLEFANGRIFL